MEEKPLVSIILELINGPKKVKGWSFQKDPSESQTREFYQQVLDQVTTSHITKQTAEAYKKGSCAADILFMHLQSKVLPLYSLESEQEHSAPSQSKILLETITKHSNSMQLPGTTKLVRRLGKINKAPWKLTFKSLDGGHPGTWTYLTHRKDTDRGPVQELVYGSIGEWTIVAEHFASDQKVWEEERQFTDAYVDHLAAAITARARPNQKELLNESYTQLGLDIVGKLLYRSLTQRGKEHDLTESLILRGEAALKKVDRIDMDREFYLSYVPSMPHMREECMVGKKFLKETLDERTRNRYRRND